MEALSVKHNITLPKKIKIDEPNDVNSVLLISNEEDLLKFHNKFKTNDIIISIDWPTVAKLYAGIEISPYQYNYRLKSGFIWYYGWDVASGCIWRPTNDCAIEQVDF